MGLTDEHGARDTGCGVCARVKGDCSIGCLLFVSAPKSNLI
jgi:hypothetical protein